MCGIAGIIEYRRSRCTPEQLKVMSSTLAHRGPDDSGVDIWSDTSGIAAGCAFQRLSILDLTKAAHQPMWSANGRHRLVFNGEIYNYVELRQVLERRGHKFVSTGDTEVLLAALAEWGVDALPRLEGMFALAWLDTKERVLTLARDAFGIKPLFWSNWENGSAFASEIPALLTIPEVSRAPNPVAIHDYLRFGLTNHDDATVFADVRQLAPGSYTRIGLDTPGVIESKRWWLPTRTGPAALSIDDAASRLRQLFLESVSMHLRSDVPVGAALSGGIDSSGIVGAIRAVQTSDIDLHVFSFVTNEAGLDEEQWIDLAASEANAKVHKVRVGPTDLMAELDQVLLSQVEPIAGASVFAQSRVFQMAASQGIKVMLDGQGPDEMFAGYRAHITMACLSLIRKGNLRSALTLTKNASQLPGGEQVAKVVARALWTSLPESLAHLARRTADRNGRLSTLNDQWFKDRDVAGFMPGRPKGKDLLAATLQEALTQTSLPALLRYEDRNSMRWSVESRVPYLTTKIAEFALSLPESHYISDDGTSKAVLRKALTGLVPQQILERRDKIGFSVPERSWLLSISPWVEEVISSPTAESSLFNPRSIRQHWSEFEESGKAHQDAMWRVLNIIRWADMFNVSLD